LTNYIRTVLESDERVLHRGFLHWIIYAPAMFLLGASVPLLAVAIGFVLMPLALISWLSSCVTQLTTEIAVTNQRVIVKRGLIRPSTVEMNVDQIDSIMVEQSVIGRLLDFGTVTVNGAKRGIEPISRVAAPLILRKAVLSVQP
jgi:uncharacterized membrane protein YdbT with pleckstrin-like domain